MDNVTILPLVSASANSGALSPTAGASVAAGDRKSTRLNSSHLGISYAVFCLKKKNIYRLEPRMIGEKLHVWSYAFAGWLEIDGREGEISLCDTDVVRHERQTQNSVTIAHPTG